MSCPAVMLCHYLSVLHHYQPAEHNTGGHRLTGRLQWVIYKLSNIHESTKPRDTSQRHRVNIQWPSSMCLPILVSKAWLYMPDTVTDVAIVNATNVLVSNKNPPNDTSSTGSLWRRKYNDSVADDQERWHCCSVHHWGKRVVVVGTRVTLTVAVPPSV